MIPVMGHGGKREGAGRKAEDGIKPEVRFLVPMTASQRDKVKALGGAAWVRRKIDKEPLTPTTKPPVK